MDLLIAYLSGLASGALGALAYVTGRTLKRLEDRGDR